MAVCGQAGKGTRLRGGKLSTQHQTFYCWVNVTGVNPNHIIVITV